MVRTTDQYFACPPEFRLEPSKAIRGGLDPHVVDRESLCDLRKQVDRLRRALGDDPAASQCTFAELVDTVERAIFDRNDARRERDAVQGKCDALSASLAHCREKLDNLRVGLAKVLQCETLPVPADDALIAKLKDRLAGHVATETTLRQQGSCDTMAAARLADELNQARADRDQAIVDRNQARAERDQARAARDAFCRDRDVARKDRAELHKQCDAYRQDRDQARVARDAACKDLFTANCDRLHIRNRMISILVDADGNAPACDSARLIRLRDLATAGGAAGRSATLLATLRTKLREVVARFGINIGARDDAAMVGAISDKLAEGAGAVVKADQAEHHAAEMSGLYNRLRKQLALALGLPSIPSDDGLLGLLKDRLQPSGDGDISRALEAINSTLAAGNLANRVADPGEGPSKAESHTGCSWESLLRQALQYSNRRIPGSDAPRMYTADVFATADQIDRIRKAVTPPGYVGAVPLTLAEVADRVEWVSAIDHVGAEFVAAHCRLTDREATAAK